MMDGMTFEKVGATTGVAGKFQVCSCQEDPRKATSNQAPAPLVGCLLFWNCLRFEHVTVLKVTQLSEQLYEPCTIV